MYFSGNLRFSENAYFFRDPKKNNKKVREKSSLGTLINVLLSIFCIKYAMSEHSNPLNQLVKISSKSKISEISVTFYWNPIVILTVTIAVSNWNFGAFWICLRF